MLLMNLVMFPMNLLVNSEIYLWKCVEKRLIPFIHKDNIIYWPDMTMFRYTLEVTEYLRSQKIEFMDKEDNSQGRWIQKFWALCKREHRKESEKFKNLTSRIAVKRRAVQNLRKNYN